MIKFAQGSKVKLRGSCWFDSSGGSIPLYWKSTSSSTDWFANSNWYSDSGGANAASAPAGGENVYVVGSIRPIALITNAEDWVNPNSINVGTLGMGLSSAEPVTISTNFRGSGVVSVSGQITIDDPS